ncbi:MAG: 2-amino-4-hydroxy-6-hydroxymethyldihydropteridine diphosphokinase [Muribaculaceae bacterium]|nr:2-amino-4-hydroxy-6-hydroxymethyldihydropteridine diphosphokinase [Muribaculaceae bacterium]
MPTAHVNIGSNLGNSRSLIEQAVAGISVLCGGNLRRSQFIESEPWGYASTNRFVNIGVEFDTTHPPRELLSRLLKIQNSISDASHRTPQGGYADRLIDIDLIYYGDITVSTPALTLPHPRLHLRDFVLIPLSELAPHWRHPQLHLTPAQMLALLQTT